MAAENVPSGVETLLQILVGNDWPEGNGGDLRSMATAWRDLGAGLRSVIDETQIAAGYVAKGITGTALQSFQAYIGPLTATDGYLPGMVAMCGGLADALDSMALEIETLRIVIIEGLVFLAAQIAADIAAAVLTFGGSLGLIEGAMLAFRMSALTLIRKAITSLIAHVAASITNQVFTTLFAEFVEWAQRVRHGFDGSLVEIAVQNGAIGGAIGFGMGNLGSLLKGGMGKLAKVLSVPDAITHLPNSVKSAAKAPLDIGWGAASGTAEAAAQDAGSGSSGDEVSGAENGAFSGGRDRFHVSVNSGDKFSLSPSHYIYGGVNSLFDEQSGSAATSTPATETKDGPPVLDWSPPGNEGSWSDDVLNSLNQHLQPPESPSPFDAGWSAGTTDTDVGATTESDVPSSGSTGLATSRALAGFEAEQESQPSATSVLEPHAATVAAPVGE